MNGWLVAPQAGVYGTDYLLRAAIAQRGLGGNIAQEALYPGWLQIAKEIHLAETAVIWYILTQDKPLQYMLSGLFRCITTTASS